MLEQGLNKEYLPIEGLAAFNTATASLLLGADNPLLAAVCQSHCKLFFHTHMLCCVTTTVFCTTCIHKRAHAYVEMSSSRIIFHP